MIDHATAHRAGVHDELLTMAEVADILRGPVATLRYWRHLGALARRCPQLSGERALTCAKTNAPPGGARLGERSRGRSPAMMTGAKSPGVARTGHEAVMVHLIVGPQAQAGAALWRREQNNTAERETRSAASQGEPREHQPQLGQVAAGPAQTRRAAHHHRSRRRCPRPDRHPALPAPPQRRPHSLRPACATGQGSHHLADKPKRRDPPA